MRIVHLALKDLLQIVRDWKSFLFLLIMPIVFTLVFGFAFGGTGADAPEEDPRLLVGIQNQDQQYLSRALIELLEQSDEIRPVLLDEKSYTEMETMVREDELAAALIIPAGYTNSLREGASNPLTGILKTETTAGITAQNALQSALSHTEYATQAAQFSTSVQEDQTDEFFASSFALALEAWQQPPFTVNLTQPGAQPEENQSENAFTHSSPGMMVQFAIAGLIGAAEVLVLERKTGALQRLLTTAISKTEILLGHFLAMFVLIFTQFAVLILFAQIGLDVPYFSAPLGTLLVAVTTSLFAASMGLLIGTLAKTPEHAVVYSLIPMFILSGLGGAWVPLEFTSEAFRTIGHFTPVAWAMDGFQNIILRGLGFTSVLMPAAVLMGFAVLCFGLAAWRFKFE
ncbi:MAG: ABC transporter permease [Anaerolineae bacterium]|nr:ABC transporter permease [Anaerolineae bacterium]